MTTDPENNASNNGGDKAEETMAQRSARLEAEAHAMAQRQSANEAAAAYEEAPDIDPADAAADAQEALENIHELGADSIGEQARGIISALQDEIDSIKDQAARALAEAENTRRRSIKEREDASKFAVSGFAKDLLEVADNLRRALEALPTDLIEAEPRLKNVIDGIEGTERTMLKAFEKHGIQKIDPLDEPFNPNFHEVMFEASIPGKPAGIVMQVMDPGYILNERLLRPARVGVTKDDGTSAGEPPAGGHIDTSA